MRAGEARLEAERRRLREALEAAEGRGTRVELGRRSLEGELHRLRLSLAEREMELQTAHDRHDSAIKQVLSTNITRARYHGTSLTPSCVFQVTEGEARLASLQREVERLTAVLSKAQDGESVHKERVLALSQSLQEATAAHSATQGRLSTLQKTLGQAETERRQLQVRYQP